MMAVDKISQGAPQQPYQGLLSHWSTRLSNLTELILPTDYPRPVPFKVVEAEETLVLPDTASLAILQHSLAFTTAENDNSNNTANTISPFTILLSAFSILLHKFTGEEDIIVGSSSLSSNPLVLRVKVAESMTFEQVVRGVHEVEQEAATHEIPFTDLLHHLFPPNANVDTAPQPSLFKVRFFNLFDTNAATLMTTTATSSCDLTIFISQTPTLRRLLPIEIKIVYNSLLFAQSRVKTILDQLILVLTACKTDTLIQDVTLITNRTKPLLPDPIADMGWSEWKGAITDIFRSNALAHPNKPCVIESVDHTLESSLLPVDRNNNNINDIEDRVRTFSYSQILRGSTLVAHTLLQNGIQREDVITIYAHRSVDLVVAIMGVLMAGATFNVIDPAYPPSRQMIYLTVAKPRGLVVLKRAGELDAEVREFIGKELDVVVEIPALQVLSDGTVLGGSLSRDGDDMLQKWSHLADTAPDVAIGPDCIGTLSFTSGSTGIPKGVRGRHFSLTHFYPWMAETFGLDSSVKFTMLSGIAHDPIQRDIFTPLFLGASLYVPTSNDIGTPGRLSSWMDRHGITITHLTPAMGQLLSANAISRIPSLRHAFFVGDVLTKRDVLRLQHLAHNVAVINMYGTTETQRAVSYLRIPPLSESPSYLSEMKEIMPAGRGMQHVQLLIVNSAQRLCGVGEVGEIFVRSSGLAEGYLRLEEVTNVKFVKNWFVKDSETVENDHGLPFFLGPRDRLYRTGDLGRYLPDGNVECTGRKDDQVKIRGFRIELGEIDTTLSQCAGVRENVTLVKRDKYEEQTLVSYFVPLDAKEDLEALMKRMREWCKERLPGYAVPSVFVPLKRMPLTPNGKIDKPALPFPDTARFRSSTNTNNNTTATAPHSRSASQDPALSKLMASMTPLEYAIHTIFQSLLGIPSTTAIDLSESFFDLGGHSILATRLIFEMRNGLAVDVPMNLVYKVPTIRGLAEVVERLRGEDLNLEQQETSSSGVNSPVVKKLEVTRGINEDLEEEEEEEEEFDYASEVEQVDEPSFITASKPDLVSAYVWPFDRPVEQRPIKFFVTGVTGFLGAFLVQSLLDTYPHSKVIALARAKTDQEALNRVVKNLQDHLIWKPEWIAKGSERVTALAGDLGQPKFGLAFDMWDELCSQVDIIVHNGAMVHWVYPYSKLKAANVLGTVEALRLATTHHLKPMHFVSSTSVLDTEHYITQLELGENGRVLESDTLDGSRRGLRSGYGQSKWVSERLVMKARERGVPATIIRPGYIVGASDTGVTNVDDFLWRLVKGCIQFGKVPIISNVVNMCSVDYVANATARIVGDRDALQMGVFHMWNSHRFRFNDLFSLLPLYGYSVAPTEYIHWRTCLMDLTFSTSDNALYPLLHFVLDDLPTSTKSAELDDSNTRRVLARSRCEKNGVLSSHRMEECIPKYLQYLVDVGFLSAPVMEVGRTMEWGLKSFVVEEVVDTEGVQNGLASLNIAKESKLNNGDGDEVRNVIRVRSLPVLEKVAKQMVGRSGRG